MSDKTDLIFCGFDKWAMGYNWEAGALEIFYFRNPIEGHLYLNDANPNDLRKLAKMLSDTADKIEERVNETNHRNM